MYDKESVKHSGTNSDNKYELINKYLKRLEKIEQAYNKGEKGIKQYIKNRYYDKYITKELDIPANKNKKLIIEEQKKHSEEVIKKADEIIKQIDEKLTGLNTKDKTENLKTLEIDNEIVNDIISKINEMPYNVETTIAHLIKYNPEVEIVSPMTQGIISEEVCKQCENNGIKLEGNRDEIGGLAYYYKFKKILNTPDIKKTKVVITEESIDENGRASGAIKEVYVPAVKKDIDSTVKMLVNKIKELPVNTEISISELLGLHINDYETKELFEINKKVLSTCKENGITLNFDKYKDEIVGLPYNIPFVKE